MVNVILNGKPYQCATCKEELTIGQYQRILREWYATDPDILKRDNLNLFGILTGTDFKNMTVTVENEQAIFDCISWVFNEPFAYSKEIPKVMQIGDEIIDIPKNVGACSIGQNTIMKQITDSCQYLEEGISMAVAIFLQPEYSKMQWERTWRESKDFKFDYSKAKEIEKEVSQMPASVVYPVGFFLLSRVAQNGIKPPGIWLRIKNSLSLK